MSVGLLTVLIGGLGLVGVIPSLPLLAVTGCPDLNCATTIGSIGFGSCPVSPCYYAPVNSLTPLQVAIQSAPLVVTFTKAPGITLTASSVLYCYSQNPCTPATPLLSSVSYGPAACGCGYVTSNGALTLNQNTFLLISITDTAGATVTATGALTFGGSTAPGTAVITVSSGSGVPVSGASVTVTPGPVTGTTAGPTGTVSFTLAQGSYSLSASAIGIGTGTKTFAITSGLTTNVAVTLGGLTTSSTVISCGTVTSNGAGGTVVCVAAVTGSNPTGTVTWSQTGGNGVSSFFPASCTLVGGSCSTQYSQSGAGTTTIGAAYSGNIFNSVSSSFTSVSFTSQATTITTVGCTPAFQLTSGQAIACTAIVTMATGSGQPTGTITWTTNGGGTFTAPGTTCTLISGACGVTYAQTGYGTATITANYGGSSTLASSFGTTSVNYGTQSTCTVYLTTTVGDGTSTQSLSCFGSSTITSTSTTTSTTIIQTPCTTDLLHAAVNVLVQDGTSKPIAGATVSISGVGGQTATTNANGLACLGGILTLVGGSVTVTVTANGFTSQTASIPVSIGQVSTNTFTMQAVPTFPVFSPYLLILISGFAITGIGAAVKKKEV